MSSKPKPKRTFAVIDCEDDPRWHGLAACVVALLGRDATDEEWHHYRAYDYEFPKLSTTNGVDDDVVTEYDGFVITGSSHKCVSTDNGGFGGDGGWMDAPAWMDAFNSR